MISLVRRHGSRSQIDAAHCLAAAPQVTGEPQVVVLSGVHPGSERVPFPLQLAVAADVERDPG
jgi:hypothetical protein